MELPKRKHTRLKEYDYSLPGYYYVTIHLEDEAVRLSTVGRGLAPAETVVKLTPAGKIIESRLLLLEQRFSFVKVDKYVIMPNHIHVIFCFLEQAAGASPRPTLMDVVRTLKSFATRLCNQADGTPGRKIFQTSFYEHVIRNEAAYRECWNYIDGNPGKWLENAAGASPRPTGREAI